MLLAALPGLSFPVTAQQAFERTYKASAYVTLFSIPIFSRSAVGYGSALERKRVDDDLEIIELAFVGGSIPERAHGLNRFGYIRESVKLKANTPIEADYFGLMTSNREESLNEAKAALNGGNTEAVPYTAASAQIENHHAHCLVRHLALSAPRKPATDDLTRLMRASFARPPANALDVDKTVPVRTTHTFLYSLRSAALSPDPASRCEFLYNAKTYVLRTEKQCDDKVASELEKRNLVPQGARIMRLNGTIENQVKHERTGFTLWYQEGSATILPLRFEFRPKSFLRLVFDAEPVSRDALALNDRQLR